MDEYGCYTQQKSLSPLLAAWQATGEFLNEEDDPTINPFEVILGKLLVNKSNLSIKIQCKYCQRCFERMESFVGHATEHLLTIDENEITQLQNNAKKLDSCTNMSENIIITEHLESMKKLDEFALPLTDDFVDNVGNSENLDSEVANYFKIPTDIQQFSELKVVLEKEPFMDDIVNETESKKKEMPTSKHNIMKMKNEFKVLLPETRSKHWKQVRQTENKIFASNAVEESQNDSLYMNVEYLLEHEQEVRQSTKLTLNGNKKVLQMSSDQKNGQYECQICGDKFLLKRRLIAHEKLHTAPQLYLCPYCPSEFNDSSNMRVHINRHTGNKPYKCSECIRAFASSTELKLHSRVHTGERPYACMQCHRRFTNSTHLKAHMRRHSNERPYVCNQCNKGFYERRLLRDHEIIHSGERPFQCHLCEKTFSRRRSLLDHIKIHKPINIQAAKISCGICSEDITKDNAHICRQRDENNDVIEYSYTLGFDK